MTYLSIFSDLLIIGIQKEKRILAQGSLTPLCQFSIQLRSSLAHRRGGNAHSAQLFGNGLYLASGDTLNIHLCQGKCESSFTPQSFLQGLRIEPAFPYLWNGKGNIAYSRPQ